MLLMEEVYTQLNQNAFVETAEEFSTEWCRRSRSWYAVQKLKESEFSIEVAINCLHKVKIKIAMAHLRRKKLGAIADSDIRALSAVSDILEQYLLKEHNIAAIADDGKML